MSKPSLEDLFDITDDVTGKPQIRLQYDKNTNELYVNSKKMVTRVQFTWVQKILGILVSASIVAQGVMSVLAYFK